MTDIDKLLRDSLNKAGESYAPDNETEARHAFLRRARRRRIYTAGSVAVAGAALAALMFLFVVPGFDTRTGRQGEGASDIPSADVVARTPVGEAPAGVAAGGGAVWVANSGDGTVSVIDAQTNELTDSVEVGRAPLDVELAGGHAWVSFEDDARLAAVDVDDLSRREVELAGGGTNLEIAAGGRYLWAVSQDTPLQRIDTTDFEITEHGVTVDEPVNLTVGGGKVWVLGAEGAVDQIDESSGLDPEATLPLEAPVSPTASDLEWDGDSLWISDGDTRTIFRLDPQAGVITATVDFEGRYAHLAASHEGQLWVVVGNDSTDASLLLVDTETGEAEPGSITLAGAPGGIVAHSGSVWASGASSDGVYRTELVSSIVTPTEEEDDVVPADEILYVYPASGDLVAVHGDATEESVVQTTEDESNPSFVSEDTIAFERTDGDKSTVVTRNLETGAEDTTAVVGNEVAVGPEERAAWVIPPGDPSEQTQIRVGSLDGSGEDFFVANPEFEPLTVRNLEWDPTGSKLFYEAGRDDIGLYEVDVSDLTPRAIDPSNEAAAYIGPAASSADEIVVLRACCTSPAGYETIELGRIELGPEAPAYTKLVGLDDVGFNPNATTVTVEPAGTLDVEGPTGDRRWTVSSDRSWILSDGDMALLVDEEGEIDTLDSAEVTAAAVSPAFLE
jgi:YVTN family beta-propeller protein